MKTLFLLRHARPASAPPGGSDYDRPLAPDGEEDARKLGHLLAKMGMLPEAAVHSLARRTEDTLANLVAGAGVAIPAERAEWLYHATPQNIMEQVRQLPDALVSILVVGHAPTLHILAGNLAAGSEMERRLADDFPPGSMAIFRFPVSSWRDITEENAKPEHLLLPEA